MVRERAGAASPREPERFNKVAGAWEQKLKEDKGRVAQRTDDQGRALFKDPDGKITTKASSRRRKRDYGYNSETETVSHQAIMEPIKYARAHIAGRTSGVDQHMAEVKAFIARGNAEAKTMDATIRGHLWLDPEFAVLAVRNLQEHIKRATEVLARLEKTKQGFQQLPVEKDLDLDAEPDTASTDEYEYKVGDKVTFEDEGTSYSGEVTAIAGEMCTVQDDDGQEWTLGIDDLSPPE